MVFSYEFVFGYNTFKKIYLNALYYIIFVIGFAYYASNVSLFNRGNVLFFT